MARISVKYKPGTRVQTVCKPHLEGVVTAVIVRGKGRSYELGHCREGEPVCHIVQECELQPLKNTGKLGFGGINDKAIRKY